MTRATVSPVPPITPENNPVENALVATGMTKSFFGNTVLDGLDLDPARR